MRMCNVKQIARSDGPTEELSPDSANLCAFTELCSDFQLIV